MAFKGNKEKRFTKHGDSLLNKTLSILTLSTTSLSLMPLSTTTLSLMTLSIMTLALHFSFRCDSDQIRNIHCHESGANAIELFIA